MLVVADSSPINFLVRLECIGLLPSLFTMVLIPPTVAKELSHKASPAAVRKFIESPPDWLQVRAPTIVADIPILDPGECAAISLVMDVRADALLIDDLDGRREAVRRGIFIIGTLGILERAAAQRLIDFRAIAEQLLNAADFRIDPRLIEDALARDAARRDEG